MLRLVVCSSCGSNNPPANRFCEQCGDPLTVTCPTCGAVARGGAKFCGECGGLIDREPVVVETASPDSPATEKRLITVLFADLTNYSTFSEGRDPEDVRDFLTTYFEKSTEVLERFGGSVDKFIGDAVMAVWSVTQANEDDPERAVRAGLELVDVVAKLAADAGAPDIALRVGVHTGEAAVGAGGNQIGLVAGDNVNIAARLQTAAAPGTVMVGEATFRSAGLAIEFEPAGELTVKGKAEPVIAHRALRVVAERRGVRRGEQLEPPFVGRRDELRLLKDLLASVGRDSRARMISLVGEAGIGKSRLLWEFSKYVDGLVEPIYWHDGRSPSYGDGIAFWAVSEMIRYRARIAEEDDDPTARSKLHAAIDQHIADPVTREWVTPRLEAVLGLGTAPAGDRSELDAAVRHFFEGLSKLGTTVLVFEDVQWADSAMLDFIEELPDWWRDRPILVVAIARPEINDKRPMWGGESRGTISIRLGPLAREEMVELVAGTVPGLPTESVEAIVDKAEGVPMYAVEFLRMLIAQGDLVDVNGNYELVSAIPSASVPDSIQTIIGSRLDRLSPEARGLVQIAAVLGQDFTASGLAAIDPEGADSHPAILSQLVRRDIVEPIRDPRLPQPGQYRFLQSLIRDVTLGRMSRDLRRSRHLEVATYVESLDDPEVSMVVASHYLEALHATKPGSEADEIRARALDSMTAAITRAVAVRSHSQVLTIGRQALDLADNDTQRAPFWELMTVAAGQVDEVDSLHEYGSLALAHYRDVGDIAGVERAVELLATGYLDQAMSHQAEELIEEHRGSLGSGKDSVRLLNALARSLLLQGKTEESAMAAEKAMQAADLSDDIETFVAAAITRGTAIGSEGRFAEGRMLIEAAIDLSDRHGFDFNAMRARMNYGFLFAELEPLTATEYTQEAYDLASRAGNRIMALALAQNLTEFFNMIMEFDKVEALLMDPMIANPPDYMAQSLISSQCLSLWMQKGSEVAVPRLETAMAFPVDELDHQVGVIRSAGEAELRRMGGDPAGALADLFEVLDDPFTGFTNALSPALWAMAGGGTREDMSRFAAVADPYARILPASHRLMVLLAEPSLDVEAINKGIAVLDAEHHLTRALQFLLLAIRFSPPNSPERAAWLDEALQRCDRYDLAGVQALIDEYLT